MSKKNKAIIWGGAATAGLLLIFSAAVQTGETERKVITTFGEFSRTTTPGLSWKIPLAQGAKTFKTDPQLLTVTSPKTATADNQNLENVRVTAQYMVSGASVETLYKTAPNFEKNLHDWLLKAQKDALGTINTIDLTEEREAVSDDMRDRFQKLIQSAGLDIMVVTVNLEEFNWDEQFEASIKANMKAKNEVERSESLLRRAQIDAKTAKTTATGKADAQIAEATGQAEATKQIAAADSFAAKIKGEGEGDAFKNKISAFGGDPYAYVAFEYSKRWNGQLPETMVNGDGGDNAIFLDTRTKGAFGDKKMSPRP